MFGGSNNRSVGCHPPWTLWHTPSMDDWKLLPLTFFRLQISTQTSWQKYFSYHYGQVLVSVSQNVSHSTRTTIAICFEFLPEGKKYFKRRRVDCITIYFFPSVASSIIYAKIPLTTLLWYLCGRKILFCDWKLLKDDQDTILVDPTEKYATPSERGMK